MDSDAPRLKMVEVQIVCSWCQKHIETKMWPENPYHPGPIVSHGCCQPCYRKLIGRVQDFQQGKYHA